MAPTHFAVLTQKLYGSWTCHDVFEEVSFTCIQYAKMAGHDITYTLYGPVYLGYRAATRISISIKYV